MDRQIEPLTEVNHTLAPQGDLVSLYQMITNYHAAEADSVAIDAGLEQRVDALKSIMTTAYYMAQDHGIRVGVEGAEETEESREAKQEIEAMLAELPDPNEPIEPVKSPYQHEEIFNRLERLNRNTFVAMTEEMEADVKGVVTFTEISGNLAQLAEILGCEQLQVAETILNSEELAADMNIYMNTIFSEVSQETAYFTFRLLMLDAVCLARAYQKGQEDDLLHE